MVLQWHSLGGTWSAYDTPPSLVHGIAFIRPEQPNMCLFGQGGRLLLQVGANQYALSDNSPRVRCARAVASFGFRRRFSIESSAGTLFSYSYWTNQGDDFFRWLAARVESAQWRALSARSWSEGLMPAALRAT